MLYTHQDIDAQNDWIVDYFPSYEIIFTLFFYLIWLGHQDQMDDTESDEASDESGIEDM